MLERDSLKRITMEEVMRHPLVTETQQQGMGFSQSEPNSPLSPTNKRQAEVLFEQMNSLDYGHMFSKVKTKQVVELKLKSKQAGRSRFA